MKYLVTGAAGFIGSALARALVAQGHEVRGIDDLSSGKLDNLDGVIQRINFRRADILDEPAMRDACAGVDYVLHQAAIPSVMSSIADPLGTNRINVDGTLIVLEAARAAGVKRVVYASSCAVYGDAELPNREDMRPNPLSPYAVSKLSGEFLMSCYPRVYGLETVSLRYFNVFGPRQDAASEYAGVIAKFIGLMSAGQAPTIFGDGEQCRDFTFVENVVAANLLACTTPASEVAGKAFNIGTGSATTVNRVYEALRELLNVSGDPLRAPARTGEITRSYADISSAKDKLGYAPRVTFEAGLRQTVDWFTSRAAPAS